MQMISKMRQLVQKVHQDERGQVSLENILIIGAIALPILIFIIKFGWPKIKDYFNSGVTQLQGETQKVTNGQ